MTITRRRLLIGTAAGAGAIGLAGLGVRGARELVPRLRAVATPALPEGAPGPLPPDHRRVLLAAAAALLAHPGELGEGAQGGPLEGSAQHRDLAPYGRMADARARGLPGYPGALRALRPGSRRASRGATLTGKRTDSLPRALPLPPARNPRRPLPAGPPRPAAHRLHRPRSDPLPARTSCARSSTSTPPPMPGASWASDRRRDSPGASTGYTRAPVGSARGGLRNGRRNGPGDESPRPGPPPSRSSVPASSAPPSPTPWPPGGWRRTCSRRARPTRTPTGSRSASG